MLLCLTNRKMMKKFRLSTFYYGHQYRGFEKQKNHLDTVQQVLEMLIRRCTNRMITTSAVSRTDKGAHAFENHVYVQSQHHLDIMRTCKEINKKNNDFIFIKDIEEVEPDFDPQKNVKERTYLYRIVESKYKNPELNNLVHYTSKTINIDKMKEAAASFKGKHDLKAFIGENGRVDLKI